MSVPYNCQSCIVVISFLHKNHKAPHAFACTLAEGRKQIMLDDGHLAFKLYLLDAFCFSRFFLDSAWAFENIHPGYQSSLHVLVTGRKPDATP